MSLLSQIFLLAVVETRVEMDMVLETALWMGLPLGRDDAEDKDDDDDDELPFGRLCFMADPDELRRCCLEVAP